MGVIRNPVLRGFHPDPSILRVGREYFLATSTFEYFPAVRLHRSEDLVNWEVVGHALADAVELRGVPDSAGVWAPSLTFVDGEFWLAYSIVRSADGDDKDIENYLVTSPSITGPWSAPVYLGSRGFDFSFFHDDDGSHWIVGVQWDERPGHPSFGGLVLEQYLPEERRVSGRTHLLYQEEGLVEGPNLYHIDEWYYLLIAAGGTGWNHGITVARSRSLTGPYERDSAPAVLTSRDAPGEALQKAGHGELVQTPEGEWILAHLASRPTLHLGERYCTLGRETCLQRIVFVDGWPRLAQGGHHGAVEVRIDAAVDRHDSAGFTDDFSSVDSRRWVTLRAPLTTALDVNARPGWLRLRGGSSPASVFEQSMLLTRVEEHRTVADVVVDAEPSALRQKAGLIAWYDRNGWVWLQITWDAEHGRHARVVRRDGRSTVSSDPMTVGPGPLRLRALLDGPDIRFEIDAVGADTMAVAGVYPAWTLSDDHGERLRFTGLFLGPRVEDLDARAWSADFQDFSIRFTQE